MHLVVLKRNSIDLPDNLPPVLRPAYLKQRIAKSSSLSSNSKLILIPPVQTNPNKDLYNGADPTAVTPSNESNMERLIENEDEVDDTVVSVTQSQSKADLHPVKSKNVESENADTASIVSSPGSGQRPQPVNFDFHRQDTLRRDPTIVQPVAVRLSPDSPVVQSSDLDEDEDAHHRSNRRKASRGEVSYEKLWNAAAKEDQEDEDNIDNAVKLEHSG